MSYFSFSLRYACRRGDLNAISKCIADNTDKGQDVDWKELAVIAYDNGHADIVKCIRNSGRGTLNDQLSIACLAGDASFVLQCISDKTYEDTYVDWWGLMCTAYKKGDTDIIRCIACRDGEVSLREQLFAACLEGHGIFVSRCIGDNRDQGQGVDWWFLMDRAYSMGHTDVARCIQESGRIALHIQLDSACKHGDLTFVRQCISDYRYRGRNVDWKRLTDTANSKGHTDIVRSIQNRGKDEQSNIKVFYDKVESACKSGDLAFVLECISDNTDKGYNVNWNRLLDVAYSNSLTDIVKLIQGCNRVSVNDKLHCAYRHGDLTSISKCISDKTVSDKYVDWTWLLNTAYSKGHTDIVRCVQDNERMELYYLLEAACRHGDLTFVRQCISDYRYRGRNVDWKRLTDTANSKGHTDIVRSIQNRGKDEQSNIKVFYDKVESACKSGDLAFVLECISDNTDKGYNVNWNRLLDVAYSNSLTDIVKLIQGCNRVSVNDKLHCAYRHGDLTSISKCISDKTVSDKYVDWTWLLNTAYSKGHTDIVRCVQDNERMELYYLLEAACRHGDLAFVSQCTSGNRYKNWTRLLSIAHDKGHRDIVTCIRASKNVALCYKLESACVCGDLAFFSACISENKDEGQDVDWGKLTKTAYKEGHTNIVRCIQDNKRLPLHHQLKSACEFGDRPFVLKCISDSNVRSEVSTSAWWELSKLAYSLEHRATGNAITGSGHLKLQHVPLKDIHDDGSYNEGLSLVISKSEDMNGPLCPGLTSMHVACFGANIDIIKTLRENGASVNVKGHMGQTPLHMACQGKNEDIEKMIRDKHYSHVEVERLQYMSKLIKGGAQSHAVTLRRLKTVQYLTTNNACIDETDTNAQTSLHIACFTGASKIAEILLDAGASMDLTDGVGMSPLALASIQGHVATMTLLLQKDCDVSVLNRYKQSALYNACHWNQLHAAKILLKFPELINQADCEGVTPVTIASWHGHSKVVALLLDNQADVNLVDNEGQTSLHKVANEGFNETAVIILKCGIMLDVQDITGCTALHGASKKCAAIVQLLLEKGCKVDVPDNLGNTALHVSVSSGQIEIVRSLLSYQADINYKNHCGITPLSSAVSNLEMDIMSLLVENKADANVVDNMGRSLIHAAVAAISYSSEAQQLPRLLRFLQSCKLSVNAVDFNGQTPLHLAAGSGNAQVVKCLLDHGADATVRDKFGFMSIISAMPHQQVFDILSGPSHLNDKDRQQIKHIGYWFNVTDKDQQNSNYEHQPKNVLKLEKRVSMEKLTTWLRNEEDKLGDFMSGWLSELQPLTYVNHPAIIEVLVSFIEDLQAGVENVDPMVAFNPTISGSEKEKTKVMASNELDSLCSLKNILHFMFHIPSMPADTILKECIELVCKERYVEQLERVLDDKKRLSGAKLYKFFSKAVAEVLARPELWKKYPQIQRVTVSDITAGNRTITALIVRWHDDVYPLLDISIDLVPAVAIPSPDDGGWLPPWCKPHPCLRQMGCVAVPKWKSSAPTNLGLMEFGLSQWGQLFEEMPEEMRQGYRMAKVVRDKAVCPQIEDSPDVHASDFITSYILKQCIAKEYIAQSESEDSTREVKSDFEWASRIYEMVEEGLIKQNLESFFIPGYNLLHDEKYAQYRETAICYAKMCRRLLTPQSARHFRRAYMGMTDVSGLSMHFLHF